MESTQLRLKHASGWFAAGREVAEALTLLSDAAFKLAYRDAIRKDPANPYAHAMWGHWILWKHQGSAKASEHFAAALAAPRPALHPYMHFYGSRTGRWWYTQAGWKAPRNSS